jgi:hypothetical protein
MMSRPDLVSRTQPVWSSNTDLDGTPFPGTTFRAKIFVSLALEMTLLTFGLIFDGGLLTDVLWTMGGLGLPLCLLIVR